MVQRFKGFFIFCSLLLLCLQAYGQTQTRVVVIPMGEDSPAPRFRIVPAGSNTTANRGRLEYTADKNPSPESEWGTVCDACFAGQFGCPDPKPSLNAASMAVCKDMGYKFGFYSPSFSSSGGPDPILDEVRCPDGATSFSECKSVAVNSCNHSGVKAGVNCILQSIVFVTSSAYDGDLVTAAAHLPGGPHTGAEAGDALCQSHADAAGLVGTYKAWLSDSNSSPSTRFTHSDTWGYWRLDGAQIADDWDDLTDGYIDYPVDVTETGEKLENAYVKTGTKFDGTAGNPNTENYCHDYTTINGDVTFAVNNSTSSYWTDQGNLADACSNALQDYHLYCFQQ